MINPKGVCGTGRPLGLALPHHQPSPITRARPAGMPGFETAGRG